MSKVALLTGSLDGFGKSVADLLADDGYALALSGAAATEAPPRMARELTKKGASALGLTQDMSTSHDARAAVSKTVSAFGTLDLLVSIPPPLEDRSLHKVDSVRWESQVSDHLLMTLVASQEAAKPMVEKGKGRIVCFVWPGETLTPDFGQVMRTTLLHAISGLVKALAVELRPRGINVNAIAPAIAPPKTGDDAERAESRKMLENVSGFLRLLESDEARAITGQVISIRGDKVSTLKLVESAGAISTEGTWSAAEILRRWQEVSR